MSIIFYFKLSILSHDMSLDILNKERKALLLKSIIA